MIFYAHFYIYYTKKNIISYEKKKKKTVSLGVFFEGAIIIASRKSHWSKLKKLDAYVFKKTKQKKLGA